MNLRFTDSLTAYHQTSYTEGTSGLTGLKLDPTKLSATPAGFNYTGLSDLGNYSRLRMRWWYTETGMRQMLRQQFMMEYALTYQNFRDSYTYTENKTGKNLGFVLRLNWLF